MPNQVRWHSVREGAVPPSRVSSIIHGAMARCSKTVGAFLERAGGKDRLEIIRWPGGLSIISAPPACPPLGGALSCLTIQSSPLIIAVPRYIFPLGPLFVLHSFACPISQPILLSTVPQPTQTLPLFPHLTASIVKILINLLCQKVLHAVRPTSPPPLQSVLRSWPVESLAAYS